MNDVPGNAKENRLNSEDFLNELNKMFKEVALWALL
jgi:hypothetical protein